jgi:hypothetical protein
MNIVSKLENELYSTTPLQLDRFKCRMLYVPKLEAVLLIRYRVEPGRLDIRRKSENSIKRKAKLRFPLGTYIKVVSVFTCKGMYDVMTCTNCFIDTFIDNLVCTYNTRQLRI